MELEEVQGGKCGAGENGGSCESPQEVAGREGGVEIGIRGVEAGALRGGEGGVVRRGFWRERKLVEVAHHAEGDGAEAGVDGDKVRGEMDAVRDDAEHVSWAGGGVGEDFTVEFLYLAHAVLDQADGREGVETVLDAAEGSNGIFAFYGDDDSVHVDLARREDLVFGGWMESVSGSDNVM